MEGTVHIGKWVDLKKIFLQSRNRRSDQLERHQLMNIQTMVDH